MHSVFGTVMLSLLAIAGVTNAHASVTRFFVDGADQGDAVCLRMNLNASTWSFPINDLTSSDMACGFQGTKGVNRVCPVEDGATLTFQWQQYPQDPTKGAIDPGHKGPCAVYMKKVNSAINDTAAGDGWFKIWDAGYDESSQEWCTTKLIAAQGLLSVQLPKGLVGGYYLVRPELLALHNVPAAHNPQYYTACAQIFLESNGSLVPSSTVSIPGYVSINDSSDTYNIFTTPLSLPYPKPGPEVCTFETGSENGQSTQTEGHLPAGCLMEVGSNWCGFEVASYNDQTGCYNSGQDCWNQGQVCWDTYPPTGYTGCQTWNNKCQDIENHCNAGDYNGPPNAGSTLIPQTTSTIFPPVPLGPTMIGSSTVNAVSIITGNSTAGSSASNSLSAASSAAPSTFSSSASTSMSAPVSQQQVAQIMSTSQATTSSGSASGGSFSQPTVTIWTTVTEDCNFTFATDLARYWLGKSG